VSGELSQKEGGTEFCYRENLERLLALKRKRKRSSFTPLPGSHLPLFLATWQGLTKKIEGIEGLKLCLEKLFGFPVHASVWEEDIFPSRIGSYRMEMLDSLISNDDLVWFGSGKGKLGFCLEADSELFLDHKTGNDRLSLIPSQSGKYGFWDIAHHVNIDTGEITRYLWEMVWKGLVSNTSFDTIRKGIEHGFKPILVSNEQPHVRLPRTSKPGIGRWKSSRPLSGLWFMLKTNEDSRDEMEKETIRQDRVRQLMARYGIIFRNLNEFELPPLKWQPLFRSLRVMELSGEIVSGYFFEGVPGPQFITKESFAVLNSGLDENLVYMVNACDPASLCGIHIQSVTLPARLPSTRIVFHGTNPVIVSKRNYAELDFIVSPENQNIGQYISLISESLVRNYMPLKSIKIEKINGVRADKSPYCDALSQYGFVKDFGKVCKRGLY
jgi:ATP-dependent Lhr-like helicase